MHNLKPFSLSVFFFALACEKTFIKRYIALNGDLIGPENILFAGASMHFSARNFTDWGSEWVNQFVLYIVLFRTDLWAEIAQLVERPTEKPGAIPTRVRIPGAARDVYSKRKLPVLTHLRCSCSPRVQSLASTSVCTVKIPSTGSHTIVWTHKNTAHIDRHG